MNTGHRGRRIRFIAAMAALLPSIPAAAMPASPEPVKLTQAGGAPITLHIRGDERSYWFEDLQGYAVVLDQGNYVYADADLAGSLVPTGLLVGAADPAKAGLRPGLRPSAAVRAAQRAITLPTLPRPDGGVVAVPPIGTVKNLVVLCKFSDHTFGSHTRPQADYDVLFNTIGGSPPGIAPTGSVKDCFLENSYGLLTFDSTVAVWVTLPQTEAYYTNGSSGLGGSYPANPQGMVEDALDAVDPFVDFGQFDTDNDGYIDAISIVHSGYGAETGGGGGFWMWSHRWSLWALPGGEWVSGDLNGSGNPVRVFDYHTEPALWGTSGTGILRIGVVVHETGHFFGLPDLYDINGGGSGIGSYGMMANSWGFDSSQLYPPHLCAWSKIFLGWVAPTLISTPGTYGAAQVETNAEVYRVDQNYPSGEYLLIENRQPVGFDGVMPQGGLAIWHIDEAKPGNTDEGYPGQPGWPQNNNHYKIALLQADGNYELERGWHRGEGDELYHAAGVDLIDENTTPNTDAYQGGNIIVTHNVISNVSASGSNMTFVFGGFVDCNANGVPDDTDISSGTSQDCNTNGIPDECELTNNDCNSNGVLDECDITAGTEDDCNGNNIPDSCEIAAGGVLIDENLEGGLPAGWTASGIFQITGQCAATTHCGGSTWAYAGSTGSCAYGDGETGDLIPPTVSLAYGPTELRFCSRIDSEPFFDYGIVYVNGTLVWADSGNSNGWVDEVVSLDAFAGQTVTIDFQFTSDGGVSGMLGWQVDNIYLYSESSDCNANGIPDDCDITSGTSQDCDSNGTPDECDPDADGDGVPDACDICPGGDDTLDSDGDGVPNACDACPGFDDNLDTDGDGVPNGCDPCPNDNPDDTDGDGVCDSADICPGFDDNLDTDGDGVPDGCDPCPNDNPDDTDGDGVCDSADVCPGFDDNLDTDGDGVPDGCDPCPNDNPDDTDGDGVCDSADVCPGFDDNLDTDGDGVPNGCDPCPNDNPDDTDGDGVCDSADICPGFDDGADADGDGVPDGCDICPGGDDTLDADGDGVPDACDLCPGFDDNLDTDGDGVADDCDVCPNDNPDDTDGDGVCDSADVCPGFDDNADADGDGVPDGCDACPGNDDSADADGDGVPDGCDVCPGGDDTADGDGDGVPDFCDNCTLSNPDQLDCQPNGIGDVCDIADGTSSDGNGNSVPDECEAVSSALPEDGLGVSCVDDGPCTNTATCITNVCYVPKNRYVSISPNSANTNLTARRVSVLTGGGSSVVLGWVGAPDADGVARVVDDAARHYTDWSSLAFPIWCSDDVHCPNADCGTITPGQCDTGSVDTVLLGDCHISPGHTYAIQTIVQGVDTNNEANYSTALELPTCGTWGDVAGATVANVAAPPDGSADFGDILTVVKGFQLQGAAPDSWLDLVAVELGDPAPDLVVGFGDILASVKAFQSDPYQHPDPCTCAGLAPCP